MSAMQMGIVQALAKLAHADKMLAQHELAYLEMDLIVARRTLLDALPAEMQAELAEPQETR